MPSYNSLYAIIITLLVSLLLFSLHFGTVSNDNINCNERLIVTEKQLIYKDSIIIILTDSVQFYKEKHEETENNCNHLNDYIANYLNLSSHSYIGAGNK